MTIYSYVFSKAVLQWYFGKYQYYWRKNCSCFLDMINSQLVTAWSLYFCPFGGNTGNSLNLYNRRLKHDWWFDGLLQVELCLNLLNLQSWCYVRIVVLLFFWCDNIPWYFPMWNAIRHIFRSICCASNYGHLMTRHTPTTSLNICLEHSGMTHYVKNLSKGYCYVFVLVFLETCILCKVLFEVY